MGNHSRGKARSNIDSTLEDSFPASDPPAWNMGRDTPPGETTTAARRKRQGHNRRSAGKRGSRGAARRPAPVAAQRMPPEGRPRGRRLLSPLAWLRWALRRSARPARRRS